MLLVRLQSGMLRLTEMKRENGMGKGWGGKISRAESKATKGDSKQTAAHLIRGARKGKPDKGGEGRGPKGDE